MTIKAKVTRKCPVCGGEFRPRSTLDRTCPDYRCAVTLSRAKAKLKREREEFKAAKLEPEEIARRQEIKSWSHHNEAAQTAFNKYIRARDAGLPCASCGCALANADLQQYGARADASHFRSRGAASHLRFNTFNCAAACTRCNREKSGNVSNLRTALILRFGVDIVDRLESDNRIERFSAEYLIRIKHVFSRRARHITRLRARLSEG